MWLGSLTDAELAYPGLVKVPTLKQERWRHGGGLKVSSAALKRVRYHRAGQGTSTSRAIFLSDVADPRLWLETKLGSLASFDQE